MGCVAGDPESGEHRRGGGHRTARPGARSARSPKRDSYVRHSARVCSVSDSAPQSPTTLGRLSPDTALRTPPRPGRAPHDPARGAPAANHLAGGGAVTESCCRPARVREAQVARGCYHVTNRARRESCRHLRPFTPAGGQPTRKSQAGPAKPGRSGRHGGFFLRMVHPARRVAGFDRQPEPRA